MWIISERTALGKRLNVVFDTRVNGQTTKINPEIKTKCIDLNVMRWRIGIDMTKFKVSDTGKVGDMVYQGEMSVKSDT